MKRASGTKTAAAKPATSGSSSRFLAYGDYIDEQLGKTRGQVRGVDIASGMMTIAAGMLAFFFAAVIADHWLLPGGLGFWGRWAACALLLAGAGYYAVTEILPLCLRRINPVYAAHAIERSTPTLKNGLVNFLLLKGQRGQITEPVFARSRNKLPPAWRESRSKPPSIARDSCASAMCWWRSWPSPDSIRSSRPRIPFEPLAA